MCGRYALGVRMTWIRQSLQDRGLQVDEAPDDDEVSETYNFAPGNFGAVYRADVPDQRWPRAGEEGGQDKGTGHEDAHGQIDQAAHKHTEGEKPHYKLQSMKWGLIPFWTKRQPDYGSMMRTINCRDDSLIEDRGMWTTMKRRKRCVVICQGFYEWLKKGPGGKEKIPHFIKRKDGELMCFAGLWDCVSYEGSDEKLYTYTIITTSSNPYLRFLHDRMPAILDPDTEEMNTWLDPSRTAWSNDLQSILKPYEGELECYPVAKEVGKVGNNSPDFIVPVNSKENKSNIANFFANAKKTADHPVDIAAPTPKSKIVSLEANMKDEQGEEPSVPRVKREHVPDTPTADEGHKRRKSQQAPVTPLRQNAKMRSATHNSPLKKSIPAKPTDGSQRITNFFKK